MPGALVADVADELSTNGAAGEHYHHAYSIFMYRQTTNISCTKSKKRTCFSSRLVVVFTQSIEAMC